MRRAIYISAKCLVGLLVAVLLLMAALLGYARLQGLHIFSVQTGSMEPVIMPGEAVLVRPYAPASGRLPGIREGDVISYRSLRSDDVIITHRIVSINQQAGTVTTKGDALTVADPPITPDRIVGVAVQHVQFTGFILDFMRQPGGLAAMVYAPALIICSSEIRRLVRHYHTSHYRLYAYPW